MYNRDNYKTIYTDTLSAEELEYIEFLHFCGDYIDDFYYNKTEHVYKWDYMNDLYHEGMLNFEEQ